MIDSAKEVFIPVIVLGELKYGVMCSTRVKENLANYNKLADSYPVLEVDNVTANMYGHIKADLRKRELKMAENDLWITALVKQFNLVMVSRDTGFEQVRDFISIIKW